MEDQKFNTREGVANRIYNSLKKKAITFDKSEVVDTEDVYTRTWKATLGSGAICTVYRSLDKKKARERTDGKKTKSDMVMLLVDKDGVACTDQPIRGLITQKTYKHLEKNEDGVNVLSKKSVVITAEQSSRCEDALGDL